MLWCMCLTERASQLLSKYPLRFLPSVEDLPTVDGLQHQRLEHHVLQRILNVKRSLDKTCKDHSSNPSYMQ